MSGEISPNESQHGSGLLAPGDFKTLHALEDLVRCWVGHIVHHFTVGQRRGLGVAATQPLYVNATDSVANSVTVGPREDLAAERVAVIDVVMHRDGARVDCVRLRYRSPAVPASVEAPAGRHDFLEIELGEPFDGVAPGQTAVMRSGDTVVGHGTIK